MNVKLQAVKKTCGQLILFLVLAYLIVYASQFLSLAAFVWIVTIALVGIMAFLLYNINLDNAVFRQKYPEKPKS